MTVCEQSSQRATWPPSAAVRQVSIALMTLSWPRLTWPRLASRQAAPWLRKMSATSRAGRATDLRRASGGWLVRLRRGRQALGLRLEPQALQWAHDRTDGVGGDVGIERRCLQLRMSEQNLNH